MNLFLNFCRLVSNKKKKYEKILVLYADTEMIRLYFSKRVLFNIFKYNIVQIISYFSCDVHKKYLTRSGDCIVSFVLDISRSSA